MIDLEIIENYILRKYVLRNKILTKNKKSLYQLKLINKLSV